ncbi:MULTISPECIES: 2'-5' RNA ligase family protein [Paeniglutamicibacter]|uniref:2'-5' RNA ligase family protein n=1 Tax=Paeniglutamicibacter terrestris TaxID=2723403 RepID=A0ABX1G5W3_9MICC|nr:MULTISPECIES: 2'-5' RNA ligase family protein [Paeniglutamicibacter]ASN40276.1 2'-5' RNA ligase [Arthrobacter sp. 7749]NKG21384.1 2'-5' RNA ligase family protein [Paeniglutamicibacter terrestris]QXQ11033.1 2'-5' RNA ligase family protein [Paeniglutamicibacter sp. Y32M11]
MGTEAGQQTPSDAASATALGVVIEIPAPLEDSLRSWRQRYGGEKSALIAPHITLVSGYTTDWAAAVKHVHRVAAEASRFTVHLHGTGTFRPINPVVYLNVKEGAEVCEGLHAALVAGPIEHEVSYGYHPHLTIAHEVDEAAMDLAQEELSDESLSFTVDSIGLFGLDASGAWALREELGLGGPAN